MQVLKKESQPAPDMVGLLGRIWKDKFVESGYKNEEARDRAIEAYRQGFELQPNEYTGVNLATLLVVQGQSVSSNTELKTVGERFFKFCDRLRVRGEEKFGARVLRSFGKSEKALLPSRL